MVLLDATTGLRRSELFALKWSDVDFSHLCLNVLRSIYLRHIGDCKTEASRKPVPLDERVAADLWLWKETTRYREPDDWIFASPVRRESTRSGQMLCCKRLFARRHCEPGSRKELGWHTSSHILDASHRQWRKRESRSGVDASCQQPLHT
jgi:integrase